MEAAQRENRNVTSELYKTKNMYEETCETVEITRRENRSLQGQFFCFQSEAVSIPPFFGGGCLLVYLLSFKG